MCTSETNIKVWLATLTCVVIHFRFRFWFPAFCVWITYDVLINETGIKDTKCVFGVRKSINIYYYSFQKIHRDFAHVFISVNLFEVREFTEISNQEAVQIIIGNKILERMSWKDGRKCNKRMRVAVLDGDLEQMKKSREEKKINAQWSNAILDIYLTICDFSFLFFFKCSEFQ